MKKPIVIEAFRLGIDCMPDWYMDRVTDCIATNYGEWRKLDYAIIKTLEGDMRAERGDYVIKGVKNEVYPCKPDIFEATYERVD